MHKIGKVFVILTACVLAVSCTSTTGITDEERARLIESSLLVPQPAEKEVVYQPYEVIRYVYVDDSSVSQMTEVSASDFADAAVSPDEAVSMANEKSQQTVISPSDFSNSIAQYAFDDGLIYEIFTSPGFVTDIRLAPGETISGNAAIGDSERWQLETAESSEKGRKVTHIYVKPVTIGAETSMIIPTDQRTYYLSLKSFENLHMTGVRWTYPEITTFSSPGTGTAGTSLSIGVDVSKLNFGYTITGDDSIWKPVAVFDDSIHTYIQFDSQFNTSAGAPVLYLLPSAVADQSQVEAVNYVIKGNIYITDSVLQDKQTWCLISDNQVVKIRRS